MLFAYKCYCPIHVHTHRKLGACVNSLSTTKNSAKSKYSSSAMVILATPFASVKLSIAPNLSPVSRTKAFSFTSANHIRTFSHATLLPKIPLATSAETAITSTNSSISKRGAGPVIVIDNYDSFTYNLCQYMGELDCEFEVYRNDELTVDELIAKKPRGILISPGPGAPQDSGISLETVLKLGPTVPLFGVCMGLQCIGEAFGGKIVRAPNGVMHGKSSPVYYNEGGEDGLFAGLSNPFKAGRYHSLVIEKESFPSDVLEITAWTEDGLIMAARHKVYKYLQGVQFHPESIITDEGKTIVHNFIKMMEKKEAESYN